MRHDFVLRLETIDDEVCSLNFHCTRSQIDKVFFALAFACPSSSIKRGDLSVNHHLQNVANSYEHLNSFNQKEGK